MTVSVATKRVQYAGNDSTTVFAIPFYFITNAQIKAVKTDTLDVQTTMVLGTDYTLTGEGDQSGGTLTTLTTFATGETLTIIRNVPLTQTTDYEPYSKIPAETLEKNIDQLTMIDQQQQEELDRTLQFSEGSTYSGVEIDDPTAGAFTMWNTAKNKLINGPTTLPTGSTYTAPETGAVARTLTNRLSDFISLKDFGAVGDGVTDDSVAISNFFAAVAGKVGVVPPGVYVHSNTINMTTDSTSIIGLGSPEVGAGTKGAVFKYTGSGTAWQIGTSVDVALVWTSNIQLHNIKILTTTSATKAMYLWHLDNATFSYVYWYGHSGNTGKYGLHIRGGINNTFYHCHFQGDAGASGVIANYCYRGVSQDTGFGGDVFTTTKFVDCYFKSCLTGAYAGNGFADYHRCIFESSQYGNQHDGVGKFLDCWWEANNTYQFWFETTSDCTIDGGQMNNYAVQLFGYANKPLKLTFENLYLASNNANPILINASNDISTSNMKMSKCRINKTTFTWGGTNYAFSEPIKRIDDMDMVKYTFIETSVSASTNYSTVPTTDGNANETYLMAEDGHIIALYAWYTGTISAGGYNVSVKIDGSIDTAYFGSPAIGTLTTEPYVKYQVPFGTKITTGQTLSVQLSTDGSFAATGGDFVIYVLVAHGDDGS